MIDKISFGLGMAAIVLLMGFTIWGLCEYYPDPGGGAMIHYHGTRFSGDIAASVRSMAAKHCFVSYADSGDIEIVAEVCQSFAIDNGAFTTWKQGKDYDIDGYARFVSEWFRHPACDWYVIPDAIGGDVHHNRLLRAKWQQACPDGAAGMGVPVWHLHEPLDELLFLCNAYPRVALGSSAEYSKVGNAVWWSRMAEVMNTVCDEDGRPITKLHGFRMLDPTVFAHLPFASADSTNVARNMGIDKAWTGTYAPKNRETRALIMMERIEAHCSASRWCNKSAGVQQNLGLFG